MRVIDEFPDVRDVGAREVGIEIEMEGQRVRGGFAVAPLNFWRLDADGSLRGAESCEYILRQPIVREEVPLALSELKGYLKANQAKIDKSDRAGVHVHLNVQKEENEKVMNFVLLYLVFEDIIVRYCGDNREGNLFCLRSRDADSMLVALTNAKQTGAFGPLQHDHYRYASLNVTSLIKYGSLEFRSLETPTNLDEINGWVKILLAFKDHALNAIKASTDIVENLSRNGELNYLKAILGDEKLFKALTKQDDTAEVIRQGVRRVQHICYTKALPKRIKKTAPDKVDWFQAQPRPAGWGRAIPVMNRPDEHPPQARDLALDQADVDEVFRRARRRNAPNPVPIFDDPEDM